MTPEEQKAAAKLFFDGQNENDTKARCIAHAKTILLGWAAADPTMTPEAIDENAETALALAQAIDGVSYD